MYVVKVEHKFGDPRMKDMTTYVTRVPGRTAGIGEAAKYNLKQATKVAYAHSYSRDGHQATGIIVAV